MQEKLPGLQIARAFAALSIAYFHSWSTLMTFQPEVIHAIPFMKENGWIAVDFFFAISGYVICMIVTKPNFSRVEFMIRRIFRIYPLWLAASGFYLYLAFHPRGFQERDTWSFIAYSLTLLPTYGYPFNDVGWSLQHEIAFYVVAMLLVPRFGLIGLVTFLAAGWSAGKLYDLPWPIAQFTFFYGNFLAGILAYAAHGYVKRLNAYVLLAAGFGLLWWMLFRYGGRDGFPIALFVILLGFVNLKIKSGSITEKIGVTLGNVSYGIYLLHPLVFWYLFWMLRTWWNWAPPWSAELWRFGAITYVCGLAILSWKYFEKWAVGRGEELIERRRNRMESRVILEPAE